MKTKGGLPYTARPFKIWDDKAKRDLPWRHYVLKERAINTALALIYWMPVGSVLTVYDVRSSSVICEFRVSATGIQFLE